MLEGLGEIRFEGDDTHVCGHGLDDDRGRFTAVAGEPLAERTGVVEGEDGSQAGDIVGDAGGIADTERGDATAGAGEKTVAVAVVAAFELDDERAARAAIAVARLRRDQGSFAESAELLRALLTQCERGPDPDGQLAAEIRQSLAHTCARLNLAAEAEAHSKRVVEYFPRVKGEEHANTLAALNGLAEVYRFQRRLAFVGQGTFFEACALDDGVVPGVRTQFVEFRKDADVETLLRDLRAFAPHVVVVFRPEIIPPGALRSGR